MTTTMRKFLTSLAGASALLFSGAALPQFDPVGDDTDIFLANPLLEATRPNVLIMIDNTANWNTPFDTEKQALVNTVNNLVTEAFNVGMAMFPETGGGNDNIDGGYIRFGVRQMTPTNKARFVSMVTGLDKLGDKGNNASFSGAMAEMYRYFSGTLSISGVGKAKRDYAGNIDYNPLAADLEGWPFDDKFSDTYISPIVSGCQKNFIIVISNGKATITSNNDDAKNFLQTLVNKVPPDTIGLAPKPVGEQGEWSDEYAKYMASADCAPAHGQCGAAGGACPDGVQNVITYTIDVLPAVAGSPDHTALLQSMADAGKGRYFAITNAADTTQLENALRQIFQEVQAVNSVFASVALPVSVNVRGTNLNQVYIGQFRPESGRGPRWVGNLKMYKIGQDTQGNAFLVDSAGLRAENAATGFISPNAQSFWSATSTFWNHRPADENGAGGASDLPDGDLVEKGGSAQRLRAKYPTDQAPRQVYTCVSGSGFCAAGSLLSASPFSVGNANVTGADLGTYSKKSVVSITSALVGGTTPTATATVTAHGWSTNDVVKIDGASPNVYNQSAAITVANANEFTYVLPSLPAANVARATATNHALVSGDLVDVTAASPTEYNVTNASITRIDPSNFEYTMSGASTTTSSGHMIVGKKLVTSATGVGTSAQATVLAHGYGTAPNTVGPVTVCCANELAFNVTGAMVTIVDANSFTYNTTIPITGVANTARVQANLHGFSTGNTVTIAGSSEPVFNGSFLINVVDINTFSYTVSGLAGSTANAGMVASIPIGVITHPTTGGSRDIATVTTNVTHGFTNGQTVVISNTGGVPPAGYNGTWTVSGVAAPGSSTFLIGEVAPTSTSIRNAPTPLTSAGMLAGRSVQRIDPVVQASGTIRSSRAISGVTSLSSKANATGVINAGRPIDVNATERDNLILWTRGRDNAENEKGNTTPPDVRPSTHGDVLHSRPAVVNYGRGGGEDDVSIFYGTNDGGLRVVKGGTAAVSGDLHPDGSAVQPGDERWSFIPKEHFGKLERLRQRKPDISSENPRNYFVDGAISAFTKDANDDGKLVAADGDKVLLYLAMRRGGDFLYALDASDPGAPTFLWRKQAGDAGYGELGQTWSEAKVVRMRANARPSEPTSGNPDNLVLVMGAGYDPAVEDPNPCLIDRHEATSVRKVAVGTGFVTYTSAGTCTVTGATGSASTVLRSKGRGILVVDALDGHVIWQAGPNPSGATHNLVVADMTYAIPSDARVVDLNGDGLADAVFVGDTGGNVWRVDIGDADPANWKVRKLATLASSSATDIPNKRKLLFAPEVAFAEDALGVHLAVLLGSGDREHPFDGIVADTFYMLKDRGEVETRGSATGTRSWVGTTLTPSLGGGGGAVAGGVIRAADLQDVSSAPGATESGWRLAMRPGEKTVSSALVVGGVAIFSTNQPTVLAGTAVDACASNLGVARIYTIGAADASAVSDTDNSGSVTLSDRSAIRAGGGYVPSPVYAAIQITDTSVPSTIPSSSQGTCVGAACGDTTTAGGGAPEVPTTGIVCTGTSCWSVGTLDVGSRRRSYWYKEID